MQARILGMLSPWLQPASVSVNLRGATFEHRSFGILTSESQPWLTSALVDVQFQVGPCAIALALVPSHGRCDVKAAMFAHISDAADGRRFCPERI